MESLVPLARCVLLLTVFSSDPDGLISLALALKSSQYLQSLITHQQLAPKQSSILDELYAKHSPFKPADKSDSSASSGDGVPQILLDEALIKELLEKFELEEQAGTDLRRAVSQLEARLKDPNKSIKQ